MSKHVGKVIDILENGDAVIELSPAMVSELGWCEGDKLDIYTDENNNIIIRRIDPTNE